MSTDPTEGQPGNFVAELIEQELTTGKLASTLRTRFPPEPNGYLHIGHAKAIVLNFGLADLSPEGRCNLRFDDTNPETESTEFVDAIQEDLRWLGAQWDEVHYASDYFDQLHQWAIVLIDKGLAYVDLRSEDEIRATRGDFHTPGVESADRDRSVEENRALFAKMRAGDLEEGAAVLRAKIDLQSKDLKLRDPLMYRIRKTRHHRTGDDWCIYPMYDWAHGQSDAIENITHSVCTLEFINHRALYDWFLAALEISNPPRQIEFGRLNLTYTVLSKRKLQELVSTGRVAGWDDPRMPSLAGLRRRGYTAAAIRAFCERIGVSKNDGVVDVGMLEYELREDLNATSYRVMGVLKPIKLTITNYPKGELENFEVWNIPKNDAAGKRSVPFGRDLWVERDDFIEDPPKKWWRLAPGREVRLRGAALVTVNEVIKNDQGEVVELLCTWDPESRGGNAPDGRKVRGTIHWVSASKAIDAEVRLYDRLFSVDNPNAEEGALEDHLNPDSLEVLTGCKIEPTMSSAEPGRRVQLERLGYFVVDRDSSSENLVLNRTISLKDSWAKIAKKRR